MKKNPNEGMMQPQAIDIEEIVLGALLIEKTAIIQVRTVLTPKTFYKESHKKIFSAIVDLDIASEPIDIISVTMKLKSKGELDLVGGPYFITQLTNRVASSSNIEYHCMILKELELKREQIMFAQTILKNAYDETCDALTINEIISLEANNLLTIMDTNIEQSNVELIREATKDIEQAKVKQGVTGIKTGFDEIDHLTGGWQDSDLVIVAARPSMGKTAYILSQLRNMVVEFDYHVAFFSLEMSSKQLMTRLISNQTELPIEKLKKGTLDTNDWTTYNKKVGALTTEKLHLFDKINNILGIKSKCLELHSKGQLDCIMIDYLQLCEYPQFKNNREREISEISRTLKLLAKALNVPVICLSQLSRKVEERPSKRPQLSDLRDSGSIEQDADIVQFLFRPGYYDMVAPGTNDVDKRLALAMFKKHRNGELQNIKLDFNGALVKFDNYGSPENNNDLPF